MKKKIILMLLSIFLLLSLIGCGSSKLASADTKESIKQKEIDEVETKINYENFIQIKMGQSYNDVVNLIGEGKVLSSANNDGITYQWKGAGRVNLNVIIKNEKVVDKTQMFLPYPDAKITMDLYNKIQDGMTYAQVKDILGEGMLTSESMLLDDDWSVYQYVNKDESNASFTFINDKLFSKTQLNLK